MPQTPADTLADPNFHALPIGDQFKVMRTLDPSFAALPPKDQGTVIAKSGLKALGYDKIGEPEEKPGFWDTIGSAMHNLGQVVTTPAEGGGDQPGNGPIGRLVQGVARAGMDQAKKAGDAWRAGEHVEATGHALASVMPGVGPGAAQAGDDVGHKRWGAAAADLLMLGLPEILKALPAGVRAVAPGAEAAIRDSANTSYSRVLAPTTKGNKLRTAAAVPELIDRGVTAFTLKGLRAQTESHISSLGQAIGDAWDNLPAGTSTDLKPIYDRLQDTIDEAHSVPDANGKAIPKGPEAARAINNITSLQQTLMDVAQKDPTTGALQIPVDKVRSLRQYFDDVAKKSGRYDGKDLADQSTAEAHGVAADAIRNELAKDHPDIAALNKEYSFWKNVNQVVDDTITRKQGQAPSLSSRLATGAGYLKGGPLGAEVAGKLVQLTQTPAWGTMSAVLKSKLADAIASGNSGTANFYVTRMIQAAGANKTLQGDQPATTAPPLQIAAPAPAVAQ